MAALELISSGRSPENDMISAGQITGLTQQLIRWVLPFYNQCLPTHSFPLVCSKLRQHEELNLKIFALHQGGL